MSYENQHKSKSKILSIIFNTLMLGLGYFYIGYFKKSILSMTGIIFLVFSFYYLTVYFNNAYIFLSIYPLIFLIYVYIVIDTIKIISHKKEKNYKINRWYFMLILILIISLLLPYILKISPVRSFYIPSNSMSPTVKLGDHVIIKKGFKKISRGDIVVFKYPLNPKLFFIKRCVAVGGDKLFIKNKILYLQPHEGNSFIRKNYPEKDIITINNSLWIKAPYKNKIKTIINDNNVVNNGYYPAKLFNFNQTVIPKNSYFLMGDNRDHANDSRFWGYVKEKDIFGVFNGLICFNSKDLKRINLKVK